MPVRRPSQLALPGLPKRRTCHGGNLGQGQRKRERPFISGKPMHLVLRSEKARGGWSFLHPRHKGWIHLQALRLAQRFEAKLVGYVNVGNHLHLIVVAPRRSSLQGFLRSFSGLVARKVMDARKGRAVLAPGEKFWGGLAFSRLLAWGSQLEILQQYLSKNTRQALGIRLGNRVSKDLVKRGKKSRLSEHESSALSCYPLP